MKEKIKKIIVSFLIMSCVLCLTQTIKGDYINQPTLASTTYANYNIWKTKRNKLSTSFYKKTSSSTAKSLVLKCSNKTTKDQSYGYSYERAISGSVSLGASVPIKAITLEVGSTVEYSSSKTISASVTVPARKTYYVYQRTNTTKKKYKTTVQPQKKKKSKWYNTGDSKISYSTFKAKAPEIIITQ